jgi:hypothetical protein
MAGFIVLVVAQAAYAAYSHADGAAANPLAFMRGATAFTFVYVVGALVGFGLRPRDGGTVLQAAMLGGIAALPLAITAGYAAPSVGLPGAAGLVAVGAALVAYVAAGGLRRR